MDRGFTRRQLLRLGLVGGVVVVLPGTGLLGCGEDEGSFGSPPTPTPVPSFLTDAEQQVVQAVTARIVPTDDLPGAVETGAAQYINRMLSLVPDEHDPGNVFAGGPFSGRTPFPDPTTGTPANRFPADNFQHFIPLTRLQLLSWRVRLLGTAAVPGSDFNVGVLGPVIGLRDQYRAGIAGIESKSQQMFQAGFVGLTPQQQDMVLAKIDQTFLDLITGHTLEGMFCAPEYGGNNNLVGWQLIRYDGDSQPLGYSIFDTTTNTYNERADKPSSTANPDEDFSGVDANTANFMRVIVALGSDGPHFP